MDIQTWYQQSKASLTPHQCLDRRLIRFLLADEIPEPTDPSTLPLELAVKCQASGARIQYRVVVNLIMSEAEKSVVCAQMPIPEQVSHFTKIPPIDMVPAFTGMPPGMGGAVSIETLLQRIESLADTEQRSGDTRVHLAVQRIVGFARQHLVKIPFPSWESWGTFKPEAIKIFSIQSQIRRPAYGIISL